MASEEAQFGAGFVSATLVHTPKDASGDPRTCADVFLIPGPRSNKVSQWTEPESGAFWPRDILPRDDELRDACRVWTLEMHDVDPDLRAFQDCIWLQNYAGGAMNCIDSELDSAGGESEGASESGGKKSNNGVVVLIGHGLGGILAQAIASCALSLPDEILQGRHLDLRRKHWRVVLLATPNVSLGNENSNILDDLDQITGIVSYYGGKPWDLLHTRAFWGGLQQNCRCLVDNDWEQQGLGIPPHPHGTLRVASFREGEEDGSWAEILRSQRPNDPDINGLIVGKNYWMFGNKQLYGFSMLYPPNPVLPRNHKNMGRYKSLSDAGYGALATILKTFVIADQSNSLEASSPGS